MKKTKYESIGRVGSSRIEWHAKSVETTMRGVERMHVVASNAKAYPTHFRRSHSQHGMTSAGRD